MSWFILGALLGILVACTVDCLAQCIRAERKRYRR